MRMFKYYGGKHKIADSYPRPTHATIVEPFAGAAAYSVLHRKVASRVVLYELDERVVRLWDRLLSMSADAIAGMPDPLPGERSDDLLVAMAAGRTTRDTPERFVVSPRMSQRFRPMVNRIASVVDECRHFTVVHADYSSSSDELATWFVDPPYQPRGGRWDRTRGGRYKHANVDLDYADLASFCHERQGQVIVCEQDGATWMPWNHQIKARSGNHTAYGEVWWSNEGEPHRP